MEQCRWCEYQYRQSIDRRGCQVQGGASKYESVGGKQPDLAHSLRTHRSFGFRLRRKKQPKPFFTAQMMFALGLVVIAHETLGGILRLSCGKKGDTLFFYILTNLIFTFFSRYILKRMRFYTCFLTTNYKRENLPSRAKV